jgi:hypothetical protein
MLLVAAIFAPTSMNMISPALAGLIVPLLLGGCAPYAPTVVRENFSQHRACAPAAVEVAQKQGLPFVLPAQPAELANDAQALGAWRAKQEQTRREREAIVYYVARGCGHEDRYVCPEQAKLSCSLLEQ